MSSTSPASARTVTDGPFVESKEVLGGYSVVQADTIDETVDYVRHYLDTHRNSREINLVEALNGRNGEHLRLDASASPA